MAEQDFLSFSAADINRDRSRATKTILIVPDLKSAVAGIRTAEERLEEAKGLAAAIELDVVESLILRQTKLKPSTYLGGGQVERITELVKEHQIGLVVVDTSLSPIQQRNLEKAFNTKVLDRTALVLEIFGARASTKEGTLQVALAHLTYQKSRLVRSWTHLERQRGGTGFLGGPGETQMENDRRVLQDRIERIKKALEDVKRTRSLHRKGREGVPVVALVGYTNAGKSTLFNALAKSDVTAENMLFATLDPTLRRISLPQGRMVVLSDTVGFVSNLQTELVAAFSATLEEVRTADLILHVRDIVCTDSDAQAEDVRTTLKKIGVDEKTPMIEVWNKSDMLSMEEHDFFHNKARITPEAILVSAMKGEGLDALVELIERTIALSETELDVFIPFEDGKALAWFYDNTTVLKRQDIDGSVKLHVSVDSAHLERAQRYAN